MEEQIAAKEEKAQCLKKQVSGLEEKDAAAKSRLKQMYSLDNFRINYSKDVSSLARLAKK